jgi:hypothetical protein
LVQLVNPNVPGENKYLVNFFRTQWADQVRVGLDHSEESKEQIEGQKKLAEFWQNEEIMESYQYVQCCLFEASFTNNDLPGFFSSDCVVNGTWPTGWVEANELLAGIDACEVAQQQLAESLGCGCEDLKGAQKTEQAMLTLLWKAKINLYAQAIEVQAERHPLRNASAGNILGTKLKERILAAIKQRKAPVEKVIKSFNKRRHDYLKNTILLAFHIQRIKI